MFTNSIFAAGALLSVVAAVPMQQQHHRQKRDVVWVTETQEDVVTVPVTVTQWVEPGFTAPPAQAANHYGHHRHSPVTSHVLSTITVQPSQAPVSSPESTYVPPPPSSYEAPPSSAPVDVPPPPPTTSPVDVAPATAAAPPPAPPAPTSYSAPAAAPSQPSYGGDSGDAGGAAGDHTGEMTYWTPAVGSCGYTNTESEMVVALSEKIMSPLSPPGSNPNNNPLCGRMININHDGTSHQAKIVDTCGACANDDLDMSPALFSVFANMSKGRVGGVSWTLA